MLLRMALFFLNYPVRISQKSCRATVERRVGAYAGKGYRQLFVKNYTVVFRIDEEHKTVIIVTVRYSASQF